MHSTGPIRRSALLLTAAASLGLAGCGSGDADAGADNRSAFAATARWSAIADGPLDARYSPLAVWAGRHFYVLGGYHDDKCGPIADCQESDPPLPDGAAYDPASDTWHEIAAAPVGLSGQAVVLHDVIYVHTYPMPETGNSEFLSYDIATDTWNRHPNPTRYGWLSASGDTVVVFGDRRDAESVAFDADADRWVPLPPNPYWKSDDGYPSWTGTQFIVSSSVPSHLGQDPPLVRLVALDASLERWTDLGITDIVGTAHQVVGNRVVWPSSGTMNGGGDGTGDWGSIHDVGGIYDPRTGEWTAIPSPPVRGGLCCTVATDQQVSVSGSLLDPSTLEWTAVPIPDGGVREFAAMVGSGDTVFVWGGVSFDDQHALLDSGFVLDTRP